MLARLDALITRERARNYSVIFLVLGLAALAVNAAFGRFPVTWSGAVAAPDYLAHWTGGRMLLDGRVAQLYDPAAQAGLQHDAVPGATGVSWFVSPPVAAAPYMVLALLPYGPSALVWTAVTTALLGLALVLARPWVDVSRRGDFTVLAVVFLGSPVTLELVGAGQDSAVALVLLLLGLRLLAGGLPVTAGLVLALGIFKPQLFALVPLVFVMQRQRRALAGFVAGAVGLVVLSLPVVGVRGWQSWLQALKSPLYQQHVQVGQTWKMQSLPALATALGAPGWSGYAGLGLGAVALALWVRRTDADAARVWAVTVLTTVVFSPHVMQYDLVLLLPVMAFAMARLNIASVRLLAVLTTTLVGSIAFRAPFLEWGPWWGLVAAPWPAVPLFAIWVVAVRDRSPGRFVAVTPRTGWSADRPAARSSELLGLPRTARRAPSRRRRPPRPGEPAPAAPGSARRSAR